MKHALPTTTATAATTTTTTTTTWTTLATPATMRTMATMMLLGLSPPHRLLWRPINYRQTTARRFYKRLGQLTTDPVLMTTTTGL